MEDLSVDHSDMKSCERENIAAYLDGELDAAAALRFEEHMRACRLCAAELREQKRLLCALDFMFDADAPGMALPQNFAQVVAAHAESDMSGMRGRAEHRLALRLCLALASISCLLLGGAALSNSILVPLRLIFKQVGSLISFAGHALYDVGAGAAIILRAFGGHFIFESHPFGLLTILLLLTALLLLPLLIVRYHQSARTNWEGDARTTARS